MNRATQYLGIDIGGTKIKTVIVDQKGIILERGEIPTGDSPDSVVRWQDQIKRIVDTKSGEQSMRGSGEAIVGICAPGLVDKWNKKVLHMPERLAGIEQFDFTGHLNLDTWVINDAHAACLAEYEMHWRNQGISNMIMLTLGTGVGGAVMINKMIYQGALQRAGHFGHMTVNHLGNSTMTNMVGSLEYAIGNFSVQERTMGKFKSTRDLLDAYQNGDTLANFWWLSSVQQLATALASLINIFSPECVILGGGITSGANELLMKPLNAFMSLYEWQPDGHRVPIYPARLGKYAGAIGAALFTKAKNELNT